MEATKQYYNKASTAVKSFKDEHLTSLRPVAEFLDIKRVSKPTDFKVATERLSDNVPHFAQNYVLIIAALAVYSLLTNLLLVAAVGLLLGGFLAISKFVKEPIATPKLTVRKYTLPSYKIKPVSLYAGLGVVGLPLLWAAAPISTIIYTAGASLIVILGHASFVEPVEESDEEAIV